MEHVTFLKAAATLSVLLLASACGHTSSSVTTDQLLALVRAAPLKAGYARCAVFDADGTLWDFDLSATLVQQTLQERTAATAGLPAMNALLTTFGLPAAADVYQAMQSIDEALAARVLDAAGRRRGWDANEVCARVWPHYNWLYVGLTPAQVAERASRLLASASYRARVFSGMRAVVAALRAKGYRVRVISGGVHEFVVVGAAALGFLPDEVRGLKVRYARGRLTAEVIAPVPYKQGKATIARALCGGRPMFAFGDSVATGDAALLALAAYPVAVRPKDNHRAIARKGGMRIYLRPELGSSP